MSSTLRNVSHAHMRYLLGTRCMANPGLSIDANTNDVETDNAIIYSISGLIYALAAQAAIDISTLTGTGVGKSVANLYTQLFVFEVNAAGTITVNAGDAVLTADITAGTKIRHVPDPSSANVCPIGAVLIVNTSGAAFVFGTTTGMGTYATFYQFAVTPASL